MIVTHKLLDCNEMIATHKLLDCNEMIVTHKLLDCNAIIVTTTCLTRWNGTKFQTNTAALEEPMLQVWAVAVVATQKQSRIDL